MGEYRRILDDVAIDTAPSPHADLLLRQWWQRDDAVPRPWGFRDAGLGLAMAMVIALIVVWFRPFAPVWTGLYAPLLTLETPALGIDLAYTGVGRFRNAAKGLEIEWSQGRLDVDFGNAVQISSSEARIKGKSGRMVVERGLVTRIDAVRGDVVVECLASGRVMGLQPGTTAACGPDPHEALDAIARQVGTGAQRLDLIEVVLPETTGPLQLELMAAAIPLQVEAGLIDEALEFIDAYVAADLPMRTDRFRQLAVELEVGRGRCTEARRRSSDIELPGPVREALESCR